MACRRGHNNGEDVPGLPPAMPSHLLVHPLPGSPRQPRRADIQSELFSFHAAALPFYLLHFACCSHSKAVKAERTSLIRCKYFLISTQVENRPCCFFVLDVFIIVVCGVCRRVNVGCGPAEERVLLTGLHAVADIYCECCKTTLGWKYVSNGG